MMKLKILYCRLFLLAMLGTVSGFAQVTTIVNYDFNSGTSYGTLSPLLASNISSSASCTETWSTSAGVATGANAFTANAAGKGASMPNSSGTNTRYFQVQLGGSALPSYYSYKIYVQAQRAAAGATKLTIAYSTDGISYTNFSPDQSVTTGSPSECIYDLSAVAALNLKSAVYFRLMASGASGTGLLAFDNFQIRATKCTTPANVSAGSNQALTCSSSSVVLTGSSSTSGVTYSWSPGGSTSSSITVSSPGTYTVKVTDPSNGCSATSTVAVSTNTTAPLSAVSVPTTGLMAYWPFDGNANDLSGHGHHGAVTSASLTTDRFGNPNKAYSFNGTSSRIDVPHSSDIDMSSGNDYSISFWMKTNAGNGYVLPLSKVPLGAGWNGYYFIVNNTDLGYCNGSGKFSFYVAAGVFGDACANNLISNDFSNWYFITGQYKSSTNQTLLYVNGVLQNDIGSASGTLNNSAPLTFGACACGAYQYYNGSLDDIRFYKRLLSQDEIRALYNEPNPVSMLTCATPSLTLKAYTPAASASYSWSPGGSTSSSITVSSPGTYTVKVTDASNGCSSTSTVAVTTNTTAPLSTVSVSTASLVGYWPFNGNAQDASGVGNHGTVSGATSVADRFGNPGRAYWFNGSSDYIKVPHSSTVDMVNSGDYTISFWMRAKSVSSDIVPIAKHKSDGSWNGYMFLRNSTDMGYCHGTGKFTFYVAAGANADACADNPVSNDTTSWIFITGQYQSGSNQVKLYINSVLQSDIGTRSGNLSNLSDLIFGAHDIAHNFYRGYLDDIRLYRRLLSQDEIRALYNEPNPVSMLTCATPSITLNAYTSVAGATYSWSPGGAATSSITVSSPGTYTVKVTDPSSGCVSMSTVSITAIPCEPYYFVLKKELDAGYYDSYKKKIYFAFEEEYYDPAQGSSGSLSYTIVSDLNVPLTSSPALIEVIGDNRFVIDLSTVSGLSSGEFYRIAITNKKNEVFYARFKY